MPAIAVENEHQVEHPAGQSAVGAERALQQHLVQCAGIVGQRRQAGMERQLRRDAAGGERWLTVQRRSVQSRDERIEMLAVTP